MNKVHLDLRDGDPCPKCGAKLKATPGTMFLRGWSFAGLVCRTCNALYDNSDDSMFKAAL